MEEKRGGRMEQWKEDAEKVWALLGWEGEAQWFGTKQEQVWESITKYSGKRVMGGRLRSLDQLIRTIRNAEWLGWNLYLGLNPSRYVPGKTKLSREDITHWRYILVDLDPGGDVLVPPSPRPHDGVYRDFPDERLRFAHRIFSGRGYQYWLPVVLGGQGVPTLIPRECPASQSFITGPVAVASPTAERAVRGYLQALLA